MDAKQFVAEFGHIASAPNGVQRIRELIIFLAIHGNLSTNNSSDRFSGHQLIDEAINLKQKLISGGEIRREPELPTIQNEQLVHYPSTWAVTRLGKIINLISGQHLMPEEQNRSGIGIPYLTGASDFGDVHPNVTRWTSVEKAIAINDDLLIAVKGTIGKVNLLNLERAALGRQLMAVRALTIEPRFLRLILWANENYFLAQSIGIAIPGISRRDIQQLIVGIPSREEQKRIVAKVDELMALCDKLEAQQQEREALCKLMGDSVFAALGQAKIRTEIQDAWQRIQDNVSVVLADPFNVQNYRTALLDVVVSGLLLEDRENHESTGFMLLEQIAKRRDEWSKNSEGQEHQEALRIKKKLKKQKLSLPNIELPKHWSWSSFLQISQAVVDCHNKTAPYVIDGIHLVRTSDIRNGQMDLRHTKKISKSTYAYWARRLPPQPGDIFFTREAPMGEAATVPEGEKVCLGQRTMLIRLFPELFNQKFLLYTIYSPSFQGRMRKSAVGMTVKHLRVGDVEDLMVPVPPKFEQDKIVEIVDSLFATCDELEKRLLERQHVASELAKASVEAITGISLKEQKRMQTPTTELVSMLRIHSKPDNQANALLAPILVANNGELPSKLLWNLCKLDIDTFYQQLKLEMANGWIVPSEAAYVREEETA